MPFRLYEQTPVWKRVLLIAALLIVVATVVFSNILAKQIAKEEKKKVQLWANAYKHLNQADENTNIDFIFEVIKNNETVPVILTNDEGEIVRWRNLDSTRVANNPDYLAKQLEQMKNAHEPLVVEIAPGEVNHIYYKDSYPLVQLRYYPYVQLGIIIIFFGVAYLVFSTARTAEQNRLWAGMAKETAHQLGTPISSLQAWLELLKEETLPEEERRQAVDELENDVHRLELIAERFSKIGSEPKLEEHELAPYLEKATQYTQRRASKEVTITTEVQEHISAMINPPLFNWVLENLMKNALDAMESKGSIHINARKENRKIIIDVTDTGNGIPKNKFNAVFKPGYSTKKRGWGLGLALTKRIVEHYHNGSIIVHSSEVGKGTTFRITLPLETGKNA